MDGSFKLVFSLELKTLSGIGGDIPFEYLLNSFYNRLFIVFILNKIHPAFVYLLHKV